MTDIWTGFTDGCMPYRGPRDKDTETTHEHACPKCGRKWACTEPECEEGYERCEECMQG